MAVASLTLTVVSPVCASYHPATGLAQAGGWTTSRHYAVPTTDIPVHEVTSVRQWFNVSLRDRLWPLLAGQFGVPSSALRVIDAFVVKYTAGSQCSLPLHCDQVRAPPAVRIPL